MYRRIDPKKVEQPIETTMSVRQEAAHYLQHRKTYDELRRAYLHGYIDQKQLKQLREQVKAGDADGAIKALGVLRMYGDGEIHGNV